MLKEWKKEFYPINVSKTKKKDAISHSLKKWIGARNKNLQKYGVTLREVSIFFSGSCCSLCHHYREISCKKCPLYKVRNLECYNGIDSPHFQFINDCNPEPMIKLLMKAKKVEDNKKPSKSKISKTKIKLS